MKAAHRCPPASLTSLCLSHHLNKFPFWLKDSWQGRIVCFSWGAAESPPSSPKNIKVSQILSPLLVISDWASFRDECSIFWWTGMMDVWCESGVVTVWNHCVFLGNSQSAEQENRCGWATEGERGGHAETPGKLSTGWWSGLWGMRLHGQTMFLGQ